MIIIVNNKRNEGSTYIEVSNTTVNNFFYDFSSIRRTTHEYIVENIYTETK